MSARSATARVPGNRIKARKKYNFLKSKLSPSASVGYKPSKNFLKSKHRIKMLSLSNAFDLNDLKNFEKKISNFLNLKEKLEKKTLKK